MMKQFEKRDFDKFNFEYKRGNMIIVDLGEDGIKGSEQKGIRPCVVIQNNMGNKFSPTLIIAPITSQINSKKKLPTHVEINKSKYTLNEDSMILSEQIKVVSKERCMAYMGQLECSDMDRLNRALAISIGLM